MDKTDIVAKPLTFTLNKHHEQTQTVITGGKIDTNAKVLIKEGVFLGRD